MPLHFHIGSYLEANSLIEFEGTTSLMPPSKSNPQKPIFRMAQARVPVVFTVSGYLRYKHFDVVWGYRPPRGSPPNQSFEWLNLRCQYFLISAVDMLEMNILT